jgi:uncharacterized SAM-binding protein YcdF (DUF218 family)
MPPELNFLKPWLTVLALPPAGGLLVIALGLWLAQRYRSRLGMSVALLGLGSLWIVSCNVFAVWMGQYLLPSVPHLQLATAGATLKQQQVQGIIVLGGGAETRNREYGKAQPNGPTIARMHYGMVLARSSGLPVGFSGGMGWAADSSADTEASAVQRWMAQVGMAPLRWAESNSRDTSENAVMTAALLRKDGIERIALVTHAWHMPRAQRAFEKAGLFVTPAPMGFTDPVHSTGLEWLPSAEGLRHSRQILRELLGVAFTK